MCNIQAIHICFLSGSCISMQPDCNCRISVLSWEFTDHQAVTFSCCSWSQTYNNWLELQTVLFEYPEIALNVRETKDRHITLGNGTDNVSFCETTSISIMNSHDHMDSVTKCSASCMQMHILKLNECHISSTFDCILCIYIQKAEVIKLTEYVTKWRGLKITKSGVRFWVLVMGRCFQKFCFPLYLSLANRTGLLHGHF